MITTNTTDTIPHDQKPTPKQVTKLPFDLTMPGGAKITMEELIFQLSILKSALGRHLEEASHNRFRNPLSYPEAHGLYDIASSAYYALAGTLYADDIAKDNTFV